jgi:Tfp pilus assembly protein PilZ
MENTENKERRAHPRFGISIPALYCSVDSTELSRGYTHDISVGGICLVGNSCFPHGTCVDVILEMMDTNERIYNKGKIVWYQEVDNANVFLGIKLDGFLKPIPLVLRSIKILRQY